MFSCGSTRKAPLTPAVGISFDSIVYFQFGGLDGVETPLNNTQTKRSFSSTRDDLHEHILVELENLRDRDVQMERTLELQQQLRKEIEVKGSADRVHRERREARPVQYGFLTSVALSVGAIFASAIVTLYVYKNRVVSRT